MAHEKITGTPNKIYFSYEIDNLFDNVSVRTIYEAKHIKNQSGDSLIDDFAVQEEERTFFNKNVEDGCRRLYDIYKKMTKTKDSQIIRAFDDSITDDVVGFSIVDRACYDENYLGLIDRNNEAFLIQYVIMKWYQTAKRPDEAGVAAAQLATEASEIRDKLIQFKLRNIS